MRSWKRDALVAALEHVASDLASSRTRSDKIADEAKLASADLRAFCELGVLRFDVDHAALELRRIIDDYIPRARKR